ncbi:MAG: hypothetical protein FWD49_04200 [Firmicutes bacterium]|nr:hypothetical protein [Bacillota bacterium]
MATLTACFYSDNEWYNSNGLKRQSESHAKQLISNSLYSPKDAQWNEVTYVENHYEKYIVFVDVSARNLLGGFVRSRYFVCIRFKKDDYKSGMFYYSSAFYEVEANSKNDTRALALIKSLNDYGTSEYETSENETSENDGGNETSENDAINDIIIALLIACGRAIIIGFIAFFYFEIKKISKIKAEILELRRRNGDYNTVITMRDIRDYHNNRHFYSSASTQVKAQKHGDNNIVTTRQGIIDYRDTGTFYQSASTQVKAQKPWDALPCEKKTFLVKEALCKQYENQLYNGNLSNEKSVAVHSLLCDLQAGRCGISDPRICCEDLMQAGVVAQKTYNGE